MRNTMAHERRPTARPPTTEQILNQQTREAEQMHAQPKPAPSTSTAIAKAPEVTLPAKMPADTRTPVQRYLDTIAPVTMVGRQIRGSKDAPFVTPDNGEVVPDTIDHIFLGDQTMVGNIHFNGEGNPPDYRMGLLYDGFIPTPTEELPDRDQTKWEIGLDGKPADPWPHFMYGVFQRGDTGELFAYTTSSVTGRRALGNLLRHYDRLQKTHPDMYPVVRLKTGGFNHRDPRVGWVTVPVFAVVGRHPKDDAAKPDSSIQADLNDSIPF
jgi:hypothetical protein